MAFIHRMSFDCISKKKGFDLETNTPFTNSIQLKRKINNTCTTNDVTM